MDPSELAVRGLTASDIAAMAASDRMSFWILTALVGLSALAYLIGYTKGRLDEALSAKGRPRVHYFNGHRGK
jgi:hypothetical protein